MLTFRAGRNRPSLPPPGQGISRVVDELVEVPLDRRAAEALAVEELERVAAAVEAQVVDVGDGHALFAREPLEARQFQERVGQLVAEREARELLSLALRDQLVDVARARRRRVDDVKRPPDGA